MFLADNTVECVTISPVVPLGVVHEGKFGLTDVSQSIVLSADEVPWGAVVPLPHAHFFRTSEPGSNPASAARGLDDSQDVVVVHLVMETGNLMVGALACAVRDRVPVVALL